MNIKDSNVREMIDKSYNAGYKVAKKTACEWLLGDAPLYVDAAIAEMFKKFKRIMKKNRVMNFNSQICTTRKQSKRLLALGLKRTTADCNIMLTRRGEVYHIGFDIYHYRDECLLCGADHNYQPAWSLHRLIELYKSVEDTSLWSLDCVNYDRLIQCIGLAIKHGDFNKEYLEE